jgi:hypothetical protein
LLQRKTTTTTSSKEKKDSKKRQVTASPSKRPPTTAVKPSITSKNDASINPVLNGILYHSKIPASMATASAIAATKKPLASQLPQQAGIHQALARTAVGKGIRHGYCYTAVSQPAQPVPEQPVHRGSVSQSYAAAPLGGTSFDFPELQTANDSLSQLTNNYRNSLNDLSSQNLDDEALMPTPLDQMRDFSISASGTGAFGGFLSRESSLLDLAMIPNVDCDGQQSDFRSFGMNFVDFPNPEVYAMSRNDESDNGVESD